MLINKWEQNLRMRVSLHSHAFLGNIAILAIFHKFLCHNFLLKRKFQILMVWSEWSSLDISDSIVFQVWKYFLFIKIDVYVRRYNFLMFFLFELLLKFSDSVNSNNSVGKSTSDSIRIYPVFFIKKDFKFIRNRFF